MQRDELRRSRGFPSTGRPPRNRSRCWAPCRCCPTNSTNTQRWGARSGGETRRDELLRRKLEPLQNQATWLPVLHFRTCGVARECGKERKRDWEKGIVFVACSLSCRRWNGMTITKSAGCRECAAHDKSRSP